MFCTDAGNLCLDYRTALFFFLFNSSTKMPLMFLFFLCMTFLNGFSTQDFCTVKDNTNCRKDSEKPQILRDTSKMYKEYWKAIEYAESTYNECVSKNCSCFAEGIKRDLLPFKEKGIDEDLIESSMSRATIYQIIGKQLYRNRECMFPSRCAGVEHFLFKIISNLTDTEFIVNTRDYPQSNKHFGTAMPIFSFSKTSDYYDIMYPAWSFWDGGPAISLYPRGLGRWDQHRSSLNKSSVKIPWDQKENKAFFRGSRTSPERDSLVLLGRAQPELVDAQYTKNQAWKSNEDTLYKPPAPEIPLEDHCKYKYLFNYRGVAASFRHKHLFLCNSLVFHVGAEWLEFYYDTMKPWIHYIPVPKEASQADLKRLIMFARENDDMARKIAQRGRDFIWNKLRMSDIVCYWKRILQEYSKLLTYKPKLRNDLININKK
ncbi:O-glucosyltransferase rumi homolog [Fopius arisanus]|uniref:O-glucosyltransferase rumi homolog n=1 Tax=Fopius arisanus TaxID=64838 RepID=A0A9R1U8F3_9HYME|nr:PREDICTED: O-glucosyltransferase rumi homolog [Fopius arisanus]